MNRWDYTVRGVKFALNNDDLSFEQTRDQVVAAFRRSGWHGRNDEVQDLVEDLSSAEDVVLFDKILDTIYDCADDDGAWIA